MIKLPLPVLVIPDCGSMLTKSSPASGVSVTSTEVASMSPSLVTVTV